MQLTLLDTPSGGRMLTSAQAGLRTHIEDGPACLLAALVKRGMAPEYLDAAAFLILSWDAHAPVDPEYHRLCACGCLRLLVGRRANTKYYDGTCRVRALRARRSSDPVPIPG